jgi:predicted nucleic acid-binding Zn finger protein
MSYVPYFINGLLTFSYTNLGKNTNYVVDAQCGVCMCPYYLKHTYCKHLIHAHGHTHTHSNKIVLEQKFTY